MAISVESINSAEYRVLSREVKNVKFKIYYLVFDTCFVEEEQKIDNQRLLNCDC